MKKKLAILLTALMVVSSLMACSSSETNDDTTAAESESVEDEGGYVYATMNIPYDDFYTAELTDNDVAVDAVTSATTSKWMNYDYTYCAELDDGSGGGTIFGPKYPVLITQELFDELSGLGETEDYYAIVLDEEPVAYKEVTGTVGDLSFSEIMGGSDVVSEATYEMEVGSNWGDFEIMLSGLPEDMVLEMSVINSAGDAVETIVLSEDLSSISWESDLTVGSYTIEIADANGVYMPYSSSVVFQTDVIPVCDSSKI